MKKYLKLVLVLSTFVPALGCLNQDAPDCMIQQLYSDISYHAHESSCSLFYKCISGIRYELKCKTGFRFNLQLGTCDFSENVPCVLCNMEDTGGGDRGCPPTPTCTIPEAGQTKPYPEDCNYYIYCDITGVAIQRRCPIGQEFSPSSKRCTTPEIAGCPKCYITTPLPSTTTPSTPICPETGSCEGLTEGTLLPYPSDCSKYLYCKADESTTETTTLDPCPLPLCQPILEWGATKPHPKNCSLYIYCEMTGTVKVRTCPIGRQFSPTKSRCEDPATAGCVLCSVTTTTSEMTTTEEITETPSESTSQ
ncbi:hypothetical protein B566_EDAN008716, partial [Ephemera danica]